MATATKITPPQLAARAAGECIVSQLLDLIRRKGGDVREPLVAVGAGADLDEFLSQGIAQLDSDQLRILSARASVITADLQAARTGEPMFRGSDWRLLFYCLIGSRTLREAITRASEFFEAVDGRLGDMDLTVRDGLARVALIGVRGDDEELNFIVGLNGHMMFHEIFGWLIGRPLGGTMLLEFGDELRPLALEEARPFEILLDAPDTAMTFPERLLDEPVIRSIEDMEARPSLSFILQTGEQDSPQHVAERARGTMLQMLREEQRLPSLDRLSDLLGLGRVTLRRRLRNAGTSFNELRDDCRRQIGLDLLRRTSLPVEDVAERLDYCDSDALRTAVRSWVGMSPTEYRRVEQQRHRS